MDKSWMKEPKFSESYVSGVQSFMQFVRDNMGRQCTIRCPCRTCLNVFSLSQDEIEDHLLLKGISEIYTNWVYHGEQSEFSIPGAMNHGHDDAGSLNDGILDNEEVREDGLYDLLEDRFPEREDQQIENTLSSNFDFERSDAKIYKDLLNEAQHEISPCCSNISRLSFVVKLIHLKVYNRWSNASIDMLLGFLRSSFPKSSIPASYYEAKCMLKDLGLSYETIHACKYDCALFWGEFKERQECPQCGTSRWKVNDGRKQIPWKVLRYFPLKPRLQRLFLSRKTAKDMRWHKEKKIDDDMLRHPSDGEAWKQFDKENEWFSQDSRNVRLGLATNGFNPFGNMSTSYSMWPVILVPYNLPPWSCMKDTFLMMSLLIPGRNSPGKDIDVYMQPLIEELKDLWENGIVTYDAHSRQNFQMYAAVLWTINDFPAYGDISGWSTKGYLACPVCNEDALSRKLRNKIAFMDHRRYLPLDHCWRKSKLFDGNKEGRPKPKDLSGSDLLKQLESIEKLLKNDVPGKHPNNRKRKRTDVELNWRKKSILFELPYWEKLLLRHNLDVMHIEKNICDNLIGTLLNIEGKTKDTLQARLDLQDMKIRKELHLQKLSNGSYMMPQASYTLSKVERRDFCEFLRSVKFPDGYASNISRCANVEEGKVSGLKSHDSHVLLQRILPVAMRKYVSKDLFHALDELGYFFQRLCCKTLKKRELEMLQGDIALILCKLEKNFPPAFFDVMVHLAIHLPREALLGGPVQYRWMFPIERFLGSLKRYVRNKAHPEGSIAETYISNECLTFCSMYISGVETKFNRAERNFDGGKQDSDEGLMIFSKSIRPFGNKKYDILTEQEFEMIQWYILSNCDEVGPFLNEHEKGLFLENRLFVEERHRKQFPKWFMTRVKQLHNEGVEVSEQLYVLACGPDKRVRRFTGCIVNGIRFHTRDRDTYLKSQNSGVLVEGNHEDKDIDFFGIITDIIQLDYIKDCQVMVFKCDWFDLDAKKKRIQQDGHLLSINVNKCWYKNDPFILAIQARQVFYLHDTKLGKDWRVVQKFHHRHLFDVPEVEDFELNNNIYQEIEEFEEPERDRIILMEENDEGPLYRNDVDPNIIDANIVEKTRKSEKAKDFCVEDEVEGEDETLLEYCSEGDKSDGDEDSDID